MIFHVDYITLTLYNIKDMLIDKDLLKSCQEVSQVMKSLSHPVRLKILCALLDSKMGVLELADFCQISQPAMSQFLKRLKNEGILDSHKEQTFVYYEVKDKRLVQLLKTLKKLYC